MSNVAYADFAARSAVRSNRMENQKTGFIPLYRSVLKKPWAKDVFLRTLWENLLMGAARQPYTATFKGRQWPLQTGQLVTTSADLGLKLCDRNGDPTSRHAVDRMLSLFVKEGMISTAGEKRKGTVITITNYVQYAQKMDNLPAQFPEHYGEHSPAHDEASNGGPCGYDAAHSSEHKPEHFPENHEQQCNNNNKNIKRSSSENSGESSDNRLKKFLSAHPDAVVYTPNFAKWGTAADQQCAEWIIVLVEKVKPSTKKPILAAWANDVRLMRELDGRSHREICELFQWASKDAFWHTNILSPAKLRAKWDTLSLQRDAGATRATTGSRQVIDFNNTDWINGVFDENSL
ncbi:replication protein [Kluyvera ascorbata]|uniref:replication protein n=1 Tax=Kluyvera ascorbata TaxID=51288 RepID=UPI00242F3EC3|nr:replication protein [Kluyvera ascorbata]